MQLLEEAVRGAGKEGHKEGRSWSRCCKSGRVSTAAFHPHPTPSQEASGGTCLADVDIEAAGHGDGVAGQAAEGLAAAAVLGRVIHHPVAHDGLVVDVAHDVPRARFIAHGVGGGSRVNGTKTNLGIGCTHACEKGEEVKHGGGRRKTGDSGCAVGAK